MVSGQMRNNSSRGRSYKIGCMDLNEGLLVASICLALEEDTSQPRAKTRGGWV